MDADAMPGGREPRPPLHRRSSPQRNVARVVGAARDGVVLEVDHPGRACEATGATRNGVVAAAVLLGERDQVVLGRGLEAEREAAGWLAGGAASVAVRVEAPLELLGPSYR